MTRIIGEKEYLYWLCQIPGVGALTIKKIYDVLLQFKAVYYMEERELLHTCKLDPKIARKIVRARGDLTKNLENYHSLEARRIQFITPFDKDYPMRLRNIWAHPMGLYVKGQLPSEEHPSAAIIGARNCTEYGRQMAACIGEMLGAEGVRIISGMAYGIDVASHRGTLSAKGQTFAILGSGINICYPKEHYQIYEQIANTGGVISEFALDTPPRPGNFPMRNRLISGLADLVIVIEAKEKSGSLITVEYALEQGKDIFALPGRITDPLSLGCNQLIQAGANILTAPADLIEFFKLKTDKILKVGEKNINSLAKKEKIVYSCLDLQPKCLEQIIHESRLSVSDCMNILLGLELEGYVMRTAGNYYVKNYR